MHIIIGVSTYGSLPRVNGFIKSVMSNMEDINPHTLTFVCYDDGTPDQQAVNDRMAFCKRYGFKYVRNAENMGISFTWNRIAEYEDADLVLISNDDIRFLSPGWLTRLIFFFENNENIGGVGLPLVNEMGFNSNDPRWDAKKIDRVGAAVGACFMMRPKDLFRLENPDGSKGFWESLVSFHEETTCGLRMGGELGLYSYQLPWPPAYHMGGQSFAHNHSLIWRKEDPYMPKDQFLAYVRSTQWYVPQYEDQYSKGNFDRMSYSRAMFCKYFGIFNEPRIWTHPNGDIVDCYEEPQRKVHERLITTGVPRQVRWLDRQGQVQSCWDKEN